MPKLFYGCLKILTQEWPACFKRGKHKVPLAKNIHHVLYECYKNDPRFSKRTLRQALRHYCLTTAYLKNIVEGVYRIEVTGQPITQVTPKEARYAADLLKTRANKNHSTKN